MLRNSLAPKQILGRKCSVYYNLHKHCWSVKDQKTGHVIAHADSVTLSDSEFVVNEKGRERVLQQRQKNVHAFVRGKVTGIDLSDWMDKYPNRFETVGESSRKPKKAVAIGYNPYKYSTFVNRADETPVLASPKVVMKADRSVWAAPMFQEQL